MPENPKGSGNEPSMTDVLKQLEGTNKAIATLPGAIEKSMATVMGRFAAQMPKPSQGSDSGDKGKAPKKQVSGDDLEAMDRKDFMALIVQTIREEVVAPLQEEFGKTQTEMTKKELTKAWSDFSSDPAIKKAVEKLGPELRAVLEENPSLATRPKDVLALAKERAPEKVKELEEEAKAEAAMNGGKPKEEAKSKGDDSFGGMRPTSGTPGASGDEDEKHDMKIKDALEDAWSKTMESLPSQIIGQP